MYKTNMWTDLGVDVIASKGGQNISALYTETPNQTYTSEDWPQSQATGKAYGKGAWRWRRNEYAVLENESRNRRNG